MVLIVAGIVLAILAALRIPVALAMFLAGIAGIGSIDGVPQEQLITLAVTDTLTSYVLAALLAALLLTGLARASGLVRHIFIGLRAMGRPSAGGGLVLAMLSVAIGMSAGDSLDRQTAAAMRDRLGRAGYSPTSIFGALIGGSVLRFVVPVSAIVVSACFIAEHSIASLIMTMAVLAVLLAVVLLATAGICEFRRRSPDPAAMETAEGDRRSLGFAIAGIVLSLFLIILITSLLAGGIATPTEAFGLAVIVPLIYAVAVAATGGASFRDLFQGFVFAARKFGEIAVMLLAIGLIGRAAALSGATQSIAEVAGGSIGILILMLLLTVIVAALLGALPAALLSLILVVPAAQVAGIDQTMAVVLVIATAALGQTLPGIGRSSMFLRQCFDDASIAVLARAAWPYTIATALWLALIVLVPGLATFAPGLLR